MLGRSEFALRQGFAAQNACGGALAPADENARSGLQCKPLLSLSRNPVCTQEQTGSRTYMSEKTAKRNEDNRFLHFHVANFFKFMAANLSFTQFVT